MSNFHEPDGLFRAQDCPSPAPGKRQGDEVRSAAREAAFDFCKRLVGDIDPEYRQRYFSEDTPPETKQRTKLMQQVVLSLLRRGPTRECIEERAQRRVFDEQGGPFENDGEKESVDSRLRTMNPFLKEICELFDTANDDDAFIFLCLLFDKEIEDRFDMIAGPYMAMYRSGVPDMSNIMHDVMVHAQWKCFGIKNPSEHKKRESSLMCISDVAGKARAAYGLPPYSEIQRQFV